MKPAFATDSTAKHKFYFSLSALRPIIFERMVLSFTTSFSTFSALQRMDWLSLQRVINSRSKFMSNISFRYNHCILENCKLQLNGMLSNCIGSHGPSDVIGPKTRSILKRVRSQKFLRTLIFFVAQKISAGNETTSTFFGYFWIRSNGEKPTNRLLVQLSAPRPWLCAAIDQRPTFFLIDCSLRYQIKSLFNFCFLV